MVVVVAVVSVGIEEGAEADVGFAGGICSGVGMAAAGPADGAALLLVSSSSSVVVVSAGAGAALSSSVAPEVMDGGAFVGAGSWAFSIVLDASLASSGLTGAEPYWLAFVRGVLGRQNGSSDEQNGKARVG